MRRVLALLACYASAVELCNDLLMCTGFGGSRAQRLSTWFTRQIRRLKGDIVYATKHQDDVCGKKCEFDPVTGKCLACEAMNKRAREEAEAAMARDTAE